MTYPSQPPVLVGDMIEEHIQMTAAAPEPRSGEQRAAQQENRPRRLSDAELAERTYTVVAPYVTLKTRTPDGVAYHGFYAGASVPDDVPADQLRHHLANGQIVPVGEGELLGPEELEDRAIEEYRAASEAQPPAGDENPPAGLPQHVREDRRFRELARGETAPLPAATGQRRRLRGGERAGVSAEDTSGQGGEPNATASPATDRSVAGQPGPETPTTGTSGGPSQAPAPSARRGVAQPPKPAGQ